MSLSLRVVYTAGDARATFSQLAKTGCLYISTADFAELCQLSGQRATDPEVVRHGVYAQVRGIAFSVMPSDLVARGRIYFNNANRHTAMVALEADLASIFRTAACLLSCAASRHTLAPPRGTTPAPPHDSH
jgi:hypothetical protein